MAATPEADRRVPDAETALCEPDEVAALREPDAATALREPDAEAALCEPDAVGGGTEDTIRVAGNFTAPKAGDEPGGTARILADEDDAAAAGSCARTFAIDVVERTTRVPPRCGATCGT